jgi:DeoR/GlpR family transcriptional regulator of sugar metabolism
MAARALRVIIVADSTKLGRSAFAQIRRPSEVDILITDSGADPGLLKELTEIGIEVSCV